jgi:hypothetical protein
MVIDCDDCVMQHTNACDDCVVTALLHITDHPVRLVKAESEALGNLAEVGLVAPLRLVPAVERGSRWNVRPERARSKGRSVRVSDQ